MIVRPSEKRAFHRSLLRWYSIHKRDLPWRKTRDPYRIMVSEFMLQQTRIETVIPYYDRFLKLFPSLPHLARAPFQKVLRAWAGLGYYARARNLHSAAKKILKDFGGEIPSTKEELISLPGFGPYTAGAVSSIAFDQPAAALDGNVKRIVTRLSGPGSVSKKELQKIAEELIPAKRASAFNQALMDVGARVCIPGQPRCPSCPLHKYCSFQGGEDRHRRSTAKKLRKEIWTVALIERDGRFLMFPKEGKGLLAGLWQLPMVVRQKRSDSEGRGKEAPGDRKALRKMLFQQFGLRIKILKMLPSQEHIFTHIHATLKPYLCSVVSENRLLAFPAHVRWLGPSKLLRYPISRAMSKLLPRDPTAGSIRTSQGRFGRSPRR